ncbi:MAG: UDP-N-acetylmuramate:L-alanyl-gamma-D-glutamyl-meso-diaminopimelate ligase [Desulfobulbaceae bacterium]|uniref:UDP-N-acetylmuramate--L-alanine ligase n=1 Tax=Candidatus Desulfobia pelagia TaxID=2841692 RepID=A0A8J6NHU4_9BACT|nr:UDP-N-acetylmuramate:L-alanyl-gamma-D-glutamyl-meso-diaminopimelate ligase [Candidatus Desulfobia pelagia]
MTEINPALNCFPEKFSHVHLMGVCGTGMAAMAGMLKSQGYIVSGSDANVYPPMSDFLAEQGITVLEGYRPENLNPAPDLVIVGNVIARVNPEAQALAAAGIPYVSFPQALGRLFLSGRKSLVAAGTHGKTTTSSILATMLHGAGLDPGFMIGGIVQAFQCNFRIGQGDYFVVEGDEYDTAFFDKGPKFLHYQPHIAIITSIEFDHADIYADLEAVKASFRKLVAIMPEDGCLVAHLDDPVVREIVAGAPCPVLGYGKSPELDWSLGDMAISEEGTTFDVLRAGKAFASFNSRMPGAHNALNALAVIAALDRLGLSVEMIRRELAAFAGVRRRQEVRGTVNGITVIDDFAHHPTAVRETLESLSSAYKGRRLVAVFEPRTNSSRRSIFQQDYVRVFDSADEVVIKEPDVLVAIPEEKRFSGEKLASDLTARGVRARCFENTDRILDYLADTLSEGDVAAVLSNGGFDNIHIRLLERIE